MYYRTNNPIERAAEVEQLVMQGNKRKYYRLRYAPKFYGGIVTCDAVGCCLSCVYCWNFAKNDQPDTAKGEFFAPDEVFSQMKSQGQKHDTIRYRISGCEPFLGEASTKHLYEIIELFRDNLPEAQFMIETNAVMLGAKPELLLGFPWEDVRVRVSLKGKDNDQAYQVTGMKGVYDLQIKALQALKAHGIDCVYATMPNFIEPTEKIPALKGIHREQEKMQWYPGMKGRLAKAGF